MKIMRSLMLVVLIPHVTLADVVVRRDGTKVEGTVANKEQLTTNWRLLSHVAVLLPESYELVRIAIGQIDYIILDLEGKRVIIEITPEELRKRRPPTNQPNISLKTSGIGLTIFGVGALVFGGLVKLGDPELRFESGELVEEKTYNETNYALMIGGAVLIVVGMAMIGADSSRKDSRLHILTMSRHPGIGATVRF